MGWGWVRVALIAAGVGFGLACGGLMGEGNEASDPSTDGEDGEEAPENPLAMGDRYYFDRDLDPKPEWDFDYAFVFSDDGTCVRHDEGTIACTYEAEHDAEKAEGAWTLKITAYNEAKNPDGEPMEVDDLEPGEVFTIADDGASITAESGQVLKRIEGGGDEGGEGEGGETDGGETDGGATDGGKTDGGKAGGGKGGKRKGGKRKGGKRKGGKRG